MRGDEDELARTEASLRWLRRGAAVTTVAAQTFNSRESHCAAGLAEAGGVQRVQRKRPFTQNAFTFT